MLYRGFVFLGWARGTHGRLVLLPGAPPHTRAGTANLVISECAKTCTEQGI
jgi:hypothetical protein